MGPTLCFRGIDNAAYYRLADDRSHYVDETGCGNTLDMQNPAGPEAGDGLAALLGRGDARRRLPLRPGGSAGTRRGRLRSLLIVPRSGRTGPGALGGQADRGTVGHRGYDLGQFPAGWSEWNGKFRDTVRDFWRSASGTLPDLATRISGSGDLFGHGGRRPTASVNIVTVHDGFTLEDLVSYDAKHNEANGENNRDGNDDNRSWNCGVEGPTDDNDVLELRARQRRNFLATLMLSEGVPLLLGGDEFARTQDGNNNCLLPGQRAHLVRLERRLTAERADRLHRAALPPARGSPGVSPAAVLQRHPSSRHGQRRPRLVPPGRLADESAGLGRIIRPRSHDGDERRDRRRRRPDDHSS